MSAALFLHLSFTQSILPSYSVILPCHTLHFPRIPWILLPTPKPTLIQHSTTHHGHALICELLKALLYDPHNYIISGICPVLDGRDLLATLVTGEGVWRGMYCHRVIGVSPGVDCKAVCVRFFGGADDADGKFLSCSSWDHFLVAWCWKLHGVDGVL